MQPILPFWWCCCWWSWWIHVKGKCNEVAQIERKSRRRRQWRNVFSTYQKYCALLVGNWPHMGWSFILTDCCGDGAPSNPCQESKAGRIEWTHGVTVCPSPSRSKSADTLLHPLQASRVCLLDCRRWFHTFWVLILWHLNPSRRWWCPSQPESCDCSILSWSTYSCQHLGIGR